MARKINCKHGLDKRQELQARRLRVKLEASDSETLETYHKLYMEYLEAPRESFESFLKNKNIVYYSAISRVVKAQGNKSIYDKIAL